ncbi:unnamed protein product, partial [Prorocentrum cordatum]
VGVRVEVGAGRWRRRQEQDIGWRPSSSRSTPLRRRAPGRAAPATRAPGSLACSGASRRARGRRRELLRRLRALPLARPAEQRPRAGDGGQGPHAGGWRAAAARGLGHGQELEQWRTSLSCL